jgi:hypothetical protein
MLPRLLPRAFQHYHREVYPCHTICLQHSPHRQPAVPSESPGYVLATNHPGLVLLQDNRSGNRPNGCILCAPPGVQGFAHMSQCNLAERGCVLNGREGYPDGWRGKTCSPLRPPVGCKDAHAEGIPVRGKGFRLRLDPIATADRSPGKATWPANKDGPRPTGPAAGRLPDPIITRRGPEGPGSSPQGKEPLCPACVADE